MRNSLAACRLIGLLLALAGSALAGPVSLAPALSGQYQAGSGVDATFLKVPDNWQESTVLWNGVSYGSGQPVSSYSWGTGLWGIADWKTANLNPTSDMIEASSSRRVAQIAFGNDAYNTDYGAVLGTVELAPLFTGGGTALTQDNWTSYFYGYIRVTEADLYNFSVLADDGFFFRLGGAGGVLAPPLENDYLNPPNSLAFASDLQLGVGLYSFELGAYDRLEAGVVELSWNRGGGAFSRVPTANLLARDDVMAVPEPGSWALLLTGVVALAASRRRRLRQ